MLFAFCCTFAQMQAYRSLLIQKKNWSVLSSQRLFSAQEAFGVAPVADNIV